MFGFRTDSVFEWSEFKPLMYVDNDNEAFLLCLGVVKNILIILLYLSGLNTMVPILNKEQLVMVGAKNKKPN